MTTPITPPVCPGCDRPTVPRRINKAMLWGCLTGDCPVDYLEDSWTPAPPDSAPSPRRVRRTGERSIREIILDEKSRMA
jgi:hypothetical protein